ncbi:LEAF RUST 10 DISEASE-RESISTANCE LOCUS RECEPTOR-LIKE PROTEIN KINASE-like 2.3 isoform X2 [Vitis vinifera]|uniref:LEAF RUST 10 DISEASE-RESISTANCE LOCUS RECEPTOR-LIKE PROTEIN KINASE-like 2.3 isoform X2 n=1 Tax=Vitis vinifera TaxID=29760 RepID=UPI00053F34CF|nr:LEAF RUST 10 DISEASE-RESISTANCE LOCUS RECEPTOR-LIKE PROTEIN KINASE-like 2.3 isoform X2 [Vitis vinifera]|eukprot:XP_010646999.1 PREDICTED: LEAF RUST 10 DISEASE-RESISTANCE LOCUS RECEPTOR-LIKE PROTEIN KINASE-like 2.3 isoform X1 [Vitis vinifera]
MLREAQLVGVGLMTVVIHACFLSVCVAKHHKYQICSPSSCGDMRNISYPFRLQDDPPSCGYPEYELICENNRTMINLHGGKYNGKYLVTQINYHNYTIRVVDPGRKKDNCWISSPLNSIGAYLPYYESPYHLPSEWSAAYFPPSESMFYTIVLMNCEQSIRDDNYIPIIPCNTTGSSSSSPTYAYAVVGEYVSVGDIPYSCTIGTSIIIQPLKSLREPSNLSMSDLQNYMLLGLQLSFLELFCDRQCEMKGRYCYRINVTGNVGFRCYGSRNEHIPDTSEKNWLWKFITNDLFLPFIRLQEEIGNCGYYPCNIPMIGGWILRIIVIGRTMLGMLCLFAYLIYKFHRRHLSLDDSIEEFLRSQKNLQPIKYSYSDIKKMTHNFANKLGQGGFGSVYKGKLRSGRIVAVKVLVMSKANGQDFINEVATIGRIHHVNVVRLVGFCVQGSKWALIYDFMPNGSLDKFIFLKEENNTFLSWERLYKVALGVGRGIEYLHQGCDMQILHFDIKPHNILLDEDFTPKVSDFGLAKLYSTDESMVSLTAARGTLGYIAPELFYKNIGGVSYKADVYSFGMLLMEMVGRRKNVNANAAHSSQIYFPSWIYDRYDQGDNIDLGDATEDENKLVRKMVIVALWCIQMKPIDRPSMSKALEMLEGEVELLEMPPKPTLYSEEMLVEDHMSNPIEAPISLCNSMGTITLDGK